MIFSRVKNKIATKHTIKNVYKLVLDISKTAKKFKIIFSGAVDGAVPGKKVPKLEHPQNRTVLNPLL